MRWMVGATVQKVDGESVRAHAHELAAVIIEPHLTSAGVIPADRAFLAGARAVTAAMKSLRAWGA